MKRIAIVTLNGYFNYGNRLQNYALQEVLKSYGFNVDTLIVRNNNISEKNTKRPILKNKSIRIIAKKIENRIWSLLHKSEIERSKNIRSDIFKRFTLDYINETEYTISDSDIPRDLSSKYNFFVTGSDQVWNPDYNTGASVYFLTFTSIEKRIAYAPSFGVSEIKPEFIENYKEWISGMHKLSVREVDGAKIIKELTSRDATVLVDPTLLITRERWLSIAKGAGNIHKDKYLLTYFLGGVPRIYKKQIKSIAKENKLKVINLGEIRDKETYRTGPSEFIDYINNCSLFCTDSFHGAVFSILLEKPFIVFERIGSASMYSRIDTLLNKFELNSRKVENVSWGEDVFRIDFSHIPQILDVERKKSFDYLKNALEIKDAN